MKWRSIETRMGQFYVVVQRGKLVRVVLPGNDLLQQIDDLEPHLDHEDDDAILHQAALQIHEFVNGSRTALDVPLALEGTEFQQAVWAALQDIPYGETRTYGELATQIGRPGAARAVGQANRNNPLPLIVPCHRVVASGGLGGYAGMEAPEDGLKAKLIEMEKTFALS